MRRRTFLHLAAGSAAATAVGVRRARPARAQAPGPFGHGVASGDPLPDRVVLWTRVTPSPEATPGSGLGAPTDVVWEVGADPAMATVLRSGTLTAVADHDHTVHVDVDELSPFTTYWFRFRAPGLGDAVSEVGRTRTAPAPGAAPPDGVRMAVVSCSNLEAGFFTSYRHIAGRDDLDAVLHLGDYLYEYGNGEYDDPALEAAERRHDPPTEIITLSDYRRRHANYRGDADLRAMTAAHPVITVWDDHEVTNDTWREGAQNHDEGEGDFRTRQLAAYQAYFEWLPVRRPEPSADPTRIHRRLLFGDLVDLFVLDTRQYRDEPAGGVLDGTLGDPVVDDPERPFLGDEQLAWLREGLTGSTAAWKVLGNQTVFAPILLTPGLPPALSAALVGLGLDPLAVPVGGVPFNGDQWDGYRVEQAEVVALLGEVDDVVVLTGDIHSSWGNEIPASTTTYAAERLAGGGSVGVEFVCPSITSDGFAETLGSAEAAVVLTSSLQVIDPWVRYIDGVFHGYGVFDVTAERVQYDFWGVADRTDPASDTTFRKALTSDRGTSLLADGPGALGERALAPAPVVAAPAPEPTAPTATPAAPSPSPTTPRPDGRELARTGDDLLLPAAAAAGLAVTAAAAMARRRRRVEGADGTVDVEGREADG